MLSRIWTKVMVTVLFLDLEEDFVRNFAIVFLQLNSFQIIYHHSLPDGKRSKFHSMHSRDRWKFHIKDELKVKPKFDTKIRTLFLVVCLWEEKIDISWWETTLIQISIE